MAAGPLGEFVVVHGGTLALIAHAVNAICWSLRIMPIIAAPRGGAACRPRPLIHEERRRGPNADACGTTTGRLGARSALNRTRNQTTA